MTDLTIDPRLLELEDPPRSFNTPQLDVPFDGSYTFEAAPVDHLDPPATFYTPAHVDNYEPLATSPPANSHANVQELPRHIYTKPTPFGHKRLFTDDQIAIIQEHSHETATKIVERLKKQDPNMPQTQLQVKGAVENERRKKARREKNGPWTQTELSVIARSLHLAPRVVLELVRAKVPHCRKTVDQVKDSMSQMGRGFSIG